MKTVVSSSEVAHLWAHKTQAYARNSGRGSVFFEGDTIYSYGHHFPIARHVTIKGQPAVLFTTRHYSVTTSGHCSMVRSAIPADLPVIEVENVTDNVNAKFVLDAYQAKINDAVLKASRARLHKEWLLNEVQRNVGSFDRVAELFGSVRKPVVPSDQWVTEQQKLAREARAKESAAKKERIEKARKRELEQLGKWRSGEGYGRFYNLPFDYMRISGDEIETTKGASVPLEHVRKVAPLILSLLAEGKTYQRNGHSIHLGNYVIDRLDENGVLWVGCHKFERAELERIGAMVNKN